MRTARFLLALIALMGLAPAESGGGADPRSGITPVSRLSHGGPFGGRILSIAVDPHDAGILYAGTEIGLFRSEDAGASWTVLPVGREWLSPDSGIFGDSVENVVISPANSSVLFACVTAVNRLGFPPQPFPTTVHSLFRSDDSGQTWRLVLSGASTGFLSVAVSAQVVYVNSGENGFAAQSTDGGLSFTDLPLAEVRSIAVDPLVPTRVYASVSAAFPLVDVLSSEDGGQHWQTTPLVGIGAWRLHVDPLRRFLVYAEGDGLYRSEDGGAHWTADLRPFDAPIAAFALDPGGKIFAATAGGDVYESLDGGSLWSQNGATPGGLLSLAAPADALVAGMDGKGVLRSEDNGASWTARNPGLDAAPVGIIVAAPSAPGTAYALAAGFARTTDFGRTWSVDPFAPTASTSDVQPYVSTTHIGALAIDPTDARIVYASDATAGVLRSEDGGTTWSPTFATGRFVMSIAVSPQVPTTVYMADGHIWKSLDRGTTWNQVGGDYPSSAQIVVVDPTDPAYLYASDGDFWRSDNFGESWGRVYSSQDLGGTAVFEIDVDPAHPGTVYARTSGLWKSEDRGDSWSPLELPDFNGPDAMAVDARGVLSVGTQTFPTHGPPLPSTPLRSTDGGSSWRPIAPWGVQAGPIGFVTSIAADSEGRLYLGTHANGVWQTIVRAPRELAPR